jgi:DNA-binding NarL/FixJ family response regulator
LPEDALQAHIERLRRLRPARRRLAGAASVGAMFADAAAICCRELSFRRALVVSLDGGRLTAEVTDALELEDGDRLRRRLLAAPLALRPGSLESLLIRSPERSVDPARHPSQLAAAFELEQFAIAPVAPDTRTLALLVADRPAPRVEALDALSVNAFAEVLAAALERVVLRARQDELAAELQNSIASAQALIKEILEAPVALPLAGAGRLAFPLSGPIAYAAPDRLRELLTAGELRIAELLVQGQSNREIADALIVSPETVKAGVARILRKLGASNRVEAAAVIAVRLTGSDAA